MHVGPFPGHEWWQVGLLMLLFWGGVAALIALAVRAWARPAPVALATGGRPSSLEILEDRLARGEMSVEEFSARRDALLGVTPAPAAAVEPAADEEVTPEG